MLSLLPNDEKSGSPGIRRNVRGLRERGRRQLLLGRVMHLLAARLARIAMQQRDRRKQRTDSLGP